MRLPHPTATPASLTANAAERYPFRNGEENPIAFAKERQQRIDHALELSAAYRGTAMLLGDVIEADDEYTGSHSRDVVDLALAVADRLRLDPRQRQQVEFAALLHDVGKVKIPAEIINKPGPLDEDERAVMMTHTVIGEQMLSEGSARVLDEERRLALLHCVLSHHGVGSAPGARFASPEALALYRLNAVDAAVKGALEHGLGAAD